MASFDEMMTRSALARSGGGAMTFDQLMAQRRNRFVTKSGPRLFADMMAAYDAQCGVTAREAGVTFQKVAVDPERRTLAGWASIASVGGVVVTDLQGDQIEIAELRTAAHEFLRGDRASLLSHSGQPIAEIVESVILDAETQVAMGVDLGCEGWWIVAYVHDDATWRAVKAGTIAAFSVGGWAIRE